MANTYSQIYVQTVFIVENRDCLLRKEWREEAYKYMTGVVQNRGNKMIQIGGVADHVHLFVGLKPAESVADLMKWVKGETSEWINEQKFIKQKFHWQAGYGAFSYGHSQIDGVCKYIQNQEEHHKKYTFLEEYESFLKIFDIPYEERYLFKAVK